jgi:hypothetical protein
LDLRAAQHLSAPLHFDSMTGQSPLFFSMNEAARNAAPMGQFRWAPIGSFTGASIRWWAESNVTIGPTASVRSRFFGFDQDVQ